MASLDDGLQQLVIIQSLGNADSSMNPQVAEEAVQLALDYLNDKNKITRFDCTERFGEMVVVFCHIDFKVKKKTRKVAVVVDANDQVVQAEVLND